MSRKSNSSPMGQSGNVKWLIPIALVSIIAAVGAAALLVNVTKHKEEARNPFFKVVELTDDMEDPKEWGKNFPMQYDGYRKTVDMKRTRFGGSEAEPHEPTEKDPRTIVANSRIEEDPRLKTMWAGYAFSKDFREERGHAYMLDDQTFTERQNVVKQPGTCIHCHASVYVPYKKAGNGDLIKGFEIFNKMPYKEARPSFSHPVACIDCHEPNTMQLRVTRPGFMEGYSAYMASKGVPNYDVNKMATRQEMRSFVCGQCHVEYYFKGPEKRLVYPWSKGLKVDNIIDYYDETGFKDWLHKDTGAPVLKAQHPEFELWSQGIHSKSGVACADCHMPYMREGAMKISDHHIRSPLLNINRSCQTCHHFSEEELKDRAETIQAKTFDLRNRSMDALMELIADIKVARTGTSSSTEEQIKSAYQFQRYGQFMLDFIEAENSMGFHAPQEAARILAQSVDYIRQGQLALKGSAVKAPGTLPKLVPPGAPPEATPVPVMISSTDATSAPNPQPPQPASGTAAGSGAEPTSAGTPAGSSPNAGQKTDAMKNTPPSSTSK